MAVKEIERRISIRPMLSGSVIVIIMILLATLLLGILTEFGWTGTVKWSGNLYLMIIYLSIIIGSIMAGFRSNRQGWITGIGVALLSSIFILILAMLAGEKISWPVFLAKTAINSFVGAFGGIIGVNFSHPN